MKAGEYILVILLLFCACSCAKQQRVTQDIAPHKQIEISILSRFGVQGIVRMRVVYADGRDLYPYRECHVREPGALDKVERLLSELPYHGSTRMRFSKDVPVCGVAVWDACGCNCTVTILDNRLRISPGGDPHEGEFYCEPILMEEEGGVSYCGPTAKETEFVNLVKVLCPLTVDKVK